MLCIVSIRFRSFALFIFVQERSCCNLPMIPNVFVEFLFCRFFQLVFSCLTCLVCIAPSTGARADYKDAFPILAELYGILRNHRKNIHIWPSRRQSSSRIQSYRPWLVIDCGFVPGSGSVSSGQLFHHNGSRSAVAISEMVAPLSPTIIIIPFPADNSLENFKSTPRVYNTTSL